MQGRKYPTLRSLDQSSVEQLALVYWIRGIFQAQVQGCSVTWRDCLGSNMVVKNLSHLESRFFQREVRSHLLPTSALSLSRSRSLARSLARSLSLSLSLSPLSLSLSFSRSRSIPKPRFQRFLNKVQGLKFYKGLEC